MIKVLGENYFIDIDQIEEYLNIQDDEITSISGNSEVKINVLKYELVKILLETILSEQEVVDETLGMKANYSTTIPFKLASNSLLNKKLINHY